MSIASSSIRAEDRALSGLSSTALNASIVPKKDPKLEKAAKDFEAVFLRQILDAMDKTVDRSESLLSGGHAEEMFRGMMNEQIANSWSSKAGGSGFGLAENIYKQMELNMHPELSNPARHLTPATLPTEATKPAP